MRNFYIPRAVAGQKFIHFETSTDYPKDFSPRAGIPVVTWSRDLRFYAAPKTASRKHVADYIKNLNGHIIVSERMQALISQHQTFGIEALPISLVDLSGAVVGAGSVYLNLFPLVDAIDQGASLLEWNAIDPTSISGCQRLVLNDAAIAPELHFFRLKHLETHPVMSDALVEAIKAAGLTGIAFDRIDDDLEL